MTVPYPDQVRAKSCLRHVQNTLHRAHGPPSKLATYCRRPPTRICSGDSCVYTQYHGNHVDKGALVNSGTVCCLVHTLPALQEQYAVSTRRIGRSDCVLHAIHASGDLLDFASYSLPAALARMKC